MQDLRYEAITLETAYREILDSLKTSDLTAVTTTFITNVDRVYGLLRLPVVIPHVMGIIVNAVLSASGQIAGHTVSLTLWAWRSSSKTLWENSLPFAMLKDNYLEALPSTI